jgi:hypothetical protein
MNEEKMTPVMDEREKNKDKVMIDWIPMGLVLLLFLFCSNIIVVPLGVLNRQ